MMPPRINPATVGSAPEREDHIRAIIFGFVSRHCIRMQQIFLVREGRRGWVALTQKAPSQRSWLT